MITLSFDQFVEFGRNNTTNIINNMPWSFEFQGYAVSHESDFCYLITTPIETIRFNKYETLIFSTSPKSITIHRLGPTSSVYML